MSELAADPRIRMVSLHRNIDVPVLPRHVTDVVIMNFADTAAVMAQCDLIITVDTVTAHLAGALGVPTLVCLRHKADWRWGTPANPTLWYHTAQLLFQDETRRWEPVVRAARDHLTAIQTQTTTRRRTP